MRRLIPKWWWRHRPSDQNYEGIGRLGFILSYVAIVVMASFLGPLTGARQRPSDHRSSDAFARQFATQEYRPQSRVVCPSFGADREPFRDRTLPSVTSRASGTSQTRSCGEDHYRAAVGNSWRVPSLGVF